MSVVDFGKRACETDTTAKELPRPTTSKVVDGQQQGADDRRQGQADRVRAAPRRPRATRAR
eukprot:4269268-Alexandrium_andersonii.AAC.1